MDVLQHFSQALVLLALHMFKMVLAGGRSVLHNNLSYKVQIIVILEEFKHHNQFSLYS